MTVPMVSISSKVGFSRATYNQQITRRHNGELELEFSNRGDGDDP
jgi:hypothetical protein